MSWRLLISPYVVTAGFSVGVVLLTVSANGWLWATAFAALLVAIMFVFDRQRDYPALIWVIGFNWAAAIAAILSADLSGYDLANTFIGEMKVEAVELNLLAVVVYAAGLAWSTRGWKDLARPAESRGAASGERAVTIQTGVIAYFGSLMVAETISYIATCIPQIQQPLIALLLLKYVCIYLVASTVFDQGRGFLWLCIILAIEVVTGITGFFGTFKEGFFIVLIAFIAGARRPSARMWTFAAAAAVLVLVLSMAWTAIKPEYRRWVSGFSSEQIIVRSFDERISWMADHLLGSDLDYWVSFQAMIDRVDCTSIFAQYRAWQETGDEIDLPSRYLAGIEHVLTPRALFPAKPRLDDSIVTTAMTGRRIDSSTSISVGYLAEAHYDFGPRLMFLPIFLIGAAVGWTGRYFMTRKAPYVVRQAFTTTVLFSFFQFGTNFDKALGTFIVGAVTLAAVLRFVYPRIAEWMSSRRYRQVELTK